jgi:hypothetical protein
VLNADARKASFSVSAYMLELYQDDLCDLLRPADQSRKGGEVGLVLLSLCQSLQVKLSLLTS